MANYNQARRQEVFIAWKRIFSDPANCYLRKQKAIRAVVERVRPSAPFFDKNLVGILQSLLNEGVFRSEVEAARAFPALVSSGPGSDKTICTQKSVTQSDGDFGMVGPSKELLDGLKTLYISGEFSDLTIFCAGKRYRVHKAVICPRSAFFATICRSGYKEAIESKIELPDDDPEVVDMMIQYLYCLDYDVAASTSEQDSSLSESNTSETGKFHFESIEVDLSELAVSLLTHSKIYALAEKYYIAGLKTLALQKFQQAASTTWTISDIIETAQHAYSSTIAADRGIRDAIVMIIHKNPDLLSNEDMQNVLRDLGSLSYDLLIHCHKQH